MHSIIERKGSNFVIAHHISSSYVCFALINSPAFLTNPPEGRMWAFPNDISTNSVFPRAEGFIYIHSGWAIIPVANGRLFGLRCLLLISSSNAFFVVSKNSYQTKRIFQH
jgi:hypothetical protein